MKESLKKFRASGRAAAAASVLTLGLLAACAPEPQIADAPPPAAAAASTHQGLDATLWVQTSPEFRATTLQTFQLASLRLEQALEDPQWTAALEQDAAKMAGLPPAIIVDVDETLIDNSRFQARLVAENLVYEPATWDGWVQQSAAPALEGAREFLAHADSLGVTIFYVTNRGSHHEPPTRRNLEREQMPIDSSRDVVLTKGENGWTSDKTTRRQHVAETHRVLLMLGDDLNDFVSGAKAPAPEPRRELAERYREMWGTKWLMLANPGYGSWMESLYGMDDSLPDPEKQNLKSRYLDPSEP
ncbi:MAG: HAD family acid phosphatase [Acidobacteriota bacterium]